MAWKICADYTVHARCAICSHCVPIYILEKMVTRVMAAQFFTYPLIWIACINTSLMIYYTFYKTVSEQKLGSTPEMSVSIFLHNRFVNICIKYSQRYWWCIIYENQRKETSDSWFCLTRQNHGPSVCVCMWCQYERVSRKEREWCALPHSLAKPLLSQGHCG